MKTKITRLDRDWAKSNVRGWDSFPSKEEVKDEDLIQLKRDYEDWILTKSVKVD